MSMISQSIKNLKGGVSQQPDILRFPDQGEAQNNGFSSEVEGLQKRPPSVFVKRLGAQGYLGAHPHVHVINRDKFERYTVAFTGSDIRVFDLSGAEKVVHYSSGKDYITCDNPRDDLKMVTVADYTFVVNKRKVVTERTTLTHAGYPAFDTRAMVNIRGGQYGKEFVISINGTQVATHTTPLGNAPEHIRDVDTQVIVKALIVKLAATFEAAPWLGFTATEGTGYILITTTSALKIEEITCQDGFNNQLMNAFVSDVPKFSQLPAICADGYIVKISGEAGSDQDDYYVIYSLADKIWKETVVPDIPLGFTAKSMPHGLVRDADGNFTFKPLVWQDRTCGDDESNPMPSFVGDTINDVFFYRNRLGFLTGENVALSRSGDYFKMFPLSVATLADTDPIDVAVSNNRISILKHAVPFSEELLLWSDQAQFTLNSSGILTPTSVGINLSTEFEVSDTSRPYGVGRGVYFCAPRASFSSIRRYYAVQDVSSVKSAEDISAHVPAYIPNGVFNISGSSTENFVTVLTEGDESSIYFYKFLYANESLVQQSWSKWTFTGSRVLSCEMINSVMILILEDASGIFMETIEFTRNTKDHSDEPYRCYMDKKLSYTIPAGAYNDDTYETGVKLSTVYGAVPTSEPYFIVGAAGDVNRFDPPTGGWSMGDTLQLVGNRESEHVIVGKAYEFLYEFSKLLIKKIDQQGAVTTEDIGRLQLRRAWLNYQESGAFHVDVHLDDQKYRYTMSGNRLSSPKMIIGKENIDSGQLRFPIQSEAKRARIVVSSDSPTPLSLVGAGWEGNYNRRSARI